MEIITTCTREKQVCDLTDPDLILISDPFEINEIKKHFGSPDWFDYGCLFVKVIDGDYAEVYGCESSVPYLQEWVDTIDTKVIP